MALTAENELALRNASLVKFFTANRPYYKNLAKESYVYAEKYISAAKMPVRVDDVAQPVGVDERSYFLCWRSSSAPKKLAALLRISLALLSSRFSCSSACIFAASLVLTPDT